MHSAYWAPLARSLRDALPATVVAYDAMGHGRSGDFRGLRGFATRMGDHTGNVGRVVRGVLAPAVAADTPLFVLGESMGGLVVLTAALDGLLVADAVAAGEGDDDGGDGITTAATADAASDTPPADGGTAAAAVAAAGADGDPSPPCACAASSSPAPSCGCSGRCSPPPIVAAVRVLAGVLPRLRVPPGPDDVVGGPSWLAAFGDAVAAAAIQADPLVVAEPPRLGLAGAMLGATGRLGRCMEGVVLPLLLLHGERDERVEMAASEELVRRSGAADKTLRVLRGGRHQLFQDAPEVTAAAVREVTEWVRARCG
ncbi:hypothetical protein BU14_0424s0004 [Porphyra umbilicalis]|uniref:Serine aminopeptidase S33 domain-containing protein n=1 Tax=Porphyra umbilicalis TaxID=2786 RepID=A0A1X6NVB3_PORUM|nr:hypothetical protein BU14_0424s0004 [Porphyra umbilicalis]|eukprot:OSX72548.1 hypothetical protein BU14_0424s0004 [Porphyra umbilicalis]